MTPNPWEGSSSSASHEILALYGGWRFIIVFTTAINWPCPEPMYLVHVLPLYLRYISILSSHPNLDHWSTLSFGFPHQNPACISLLPHTCHTTRPSQPPWLHKPNNIRWAVQTITFIIQLSAVCWYLHSVRPKLCPQAVTWGQKKYGKINGRISANLFCKRATNKIYSLLRPHIHEIPFYNKDDFPRNNSQQNRIVRTCNLSTFLHPLRSVCVCVCVCVTPHTECHPYAGCFCHPCHKLRHIPDSRRQRLV